MAPEVKQQQDVPVESSKPSLDNVINTALTDKKLTSKERENISQKYQEYLDWKADIKEETKNSLKQFLTNSKWSTNFEKFKKDMLSKLNNWVTESRKSNNNSISVNSDDTLREDEKILSEYTLKSKEDIKDAIAKLNSSNIPLETEVIGTYKDSDWNTKNIVLKSTLWKFKVELDWSSFIDDLDLETNPEFASIKKTVDDLLKKYKSEAAPKNWDTKDIKLDTSPTDLKNPWPNDPDKFLAWSALTPWQKKWMGWADPTDKFIIARMPKN